MADRSYDLPFEDERRPFARLAVFTCGCDLAAAEAVCADDQVPAGEILDVLSRLVDKPLVTPPAPEPAVMPVKLPPGLPGLGMR